MEAMFPSSMKFVLCFAILCGIAVLAQECRHGQVWTECGDCMIRTCDDLTQCMPVLPCETKCQCPPELPIWHQNKCIEEAACPQDCANGQVWTECIGCPNTCDSPISLCLPVVCEPGCECPQELPIWHHHECIRSEDCSKNQCNCGQVWSDCTTLCPLRCETANDLVTFQQECDAECQARCECPWDKPYLHDERCITYEQCYKFVGPCSVGKPLKGDRGQEIFCGRGPSHQDCPPNSHCVVHPADRFAVCCADGP